MAYKVFISTGKRGSKNYTSTGSTPLSNKAKVRAWIKRNPVGNINTKVKITNTVSKKIVTMSKGRGYMYGRNLLNEIKRRQK
jgi:hypothetical protein|tara:strand:+ start:2021 stop:2266 length:246 start_codon:yes stop_codon:yes gene_type:complete